MLPRFITRTMRDWIQHDIIVLTSLAAYPILDLVIIPIYWLTVTYVIIGLLYITLIVSISYPRWIGTNCKPRERHKLKMKYLNRYEMCHPLPQDLMALNGVHLMNDCIYYLIKLGIPFLGFLDPMHKIGSNIVLLFLISCSYGVQISEGRLDQCKAVFRSPKPGGIPIDFLEPDNSSRNSCLDKKGNWNITTDVELWKEYFEYGGRNMEDDRIHPLTPDTTSSISDDKREYGLLRKGMTPKLCLPVIMELMCLANEADATNDDRYTFGQRPI